MFAASNSISKRLSLNPQDEEGAIVMIALKQGDHEELLFLETDERDLLHRLLIRRFSGSILM